MRLKVHQLRMVLIAANLILAGSAAAYAFSKYYKLQDKPESVKIIDPRTLLIRGDAPEPMRPEARLTMVSGSLIPKPPEVTPPGGDAEAGPGADEPEKPNDADADLGPGPLGEHWEYAFYILPENDPMNRVVILRKKEASGAQPGPAAAASKQGGVRPRSQLRPTGRVNLNQRKAVGGIQPAGDSLTFTVGQRWYKNDTVDPPVEFYIHEATREKFVYWMPGEPQKKYSLPREPHSLFLKEPELGLRPQPQPEGAEEEGKPKKWFIERPASWEDRREEDYLRMLDGEPAGPNIKLTGPQELEKDGKETDAASKKSVPKFGSGGEPRKTFTDEEKEQLREVMKSPKMSEKDRAELRKALMSGKK